MPADPSAGYAAAFRKGLGEIGYVEGQNVTVERPYSVRHGNIATEIAMHGSPSHGENMCSSPLGSANEINRLTENIFIRSG
jgi:hypothetical protein